MQDAYPAQEATTPMPRTGLMDDVQQQLGLRLEATDASVGVLVIDYLNKPSGN